MPCCWHGYGLLGPLFTAEHNYIQTKFNQRARKGAARAGMMENAHECDLLVQQLWHRIVAAVMDAQKRSEWLAFPIFPYIYFNIVFTVVAEPMLCTFSGSTIWGNIDSKEAGIRYIPSPD